MKRIVSLLLAIMMVLLATTAMAAPTVSVLTTRNSTATNNIEDVWWFKFLAQKFDVEFDLEQTMETAQRTSLMFASDDLPDLVWGIGLSNNDVMIYGVQEGMLLAWNDLLTPELMPNACKAMEDYPDAFAASTAPDGKIYALPMITGSNYYANTGSFSAAQRMYVNLEWLKACGIESVPSTLDEMLAALRAFKAQDPAQLGDAMIPLIGNQNKDKTLVWNALGFHGTATQKYGTAFDIKNNKLALPCYTEEAKEFITFYNTLYTEGLISPDYFTMDQTAARGLIGSNVCGMFGDSTINALGDAWPAWTSMSPLTSDVNDRSVAALNPNYSLGQLYASSYTNNPELLAKIVDFTYSEDGALLYYYGPMKGTEECMGLVDGWYFDEKGSITNDKVVAGEYTEIGEYAYQYIKPYSSAPGRYDRYTSTAAAWAGVESPARQMVIIDQITGAEIPSVAMDVYTDDNNDGHWRVHQSAAMIDHLTQVRLPAVYLTPEQNQRVADLKTVIEDYVAAETAKFIVGTRPLSELDNYFAELKGLGIEEYIAIHEDAYATYLATLQ